MSDPKRRCCGPRDEVGEGEARGGRRLVIEFLYLDLAECSRCREAESNLEEALREVAPVLEATGVEVEVVKTHVQDEQQALKWGLISSPTIRINGRDIQLEVWESPCEPCGELCGEDVECRIWVYQGREYTAPPKAMLIEAVLREAYGGSQQAIPPTPRPSEVPLNLRRFFASRHKKKARGDSPCCRTGPGDCCGKST